MRKVLLKTMAVLMVIGLLLGCIPVSLASAASATSVSTGVTCDRDMIFVTRYKYWDSSTGLWSGDDFGSRLSGSATSAYKIDGVAAFCLQAEVPYGDGADYAEGGTAEQYWDTLEKHATPVANQIARTVAITKNFMLEIDAADGANATVSGTNYKKRDIMQVAGAAIIREFLCAYRDPNTAFAYDHVLGVSASQYGCTQDKNKVWSHKCGKHDIAYNGGVVSEDPRALINAC